MPPWASARAQGRRAGQTGTTAIAAPSRSVERSQKVARLGSGRHQRRPDGDDIGAHEDPHRDRRR